MKTSTLTASLITALLLAGCGSDSSSPAQEFTDITVERGPVLNAMLIDAKGQVGKSQGNGVYRFNAPEYPIRSYGGYIDMNRDGFVNEGDLSMAQLQLQTAEGSVMTMATTMAQNGELYTYMQGLGLSEDELLRQRPSTDIDVAALSDEMYKYCVENNVSDPSQLQAGDMDQVRGRLQDRTKNYNDSNMSAQELEYLLINEEMQIPTLSTESVALLDQTGAQNTNNELIINSIAASELTDEQKYTIAYMWNEEKLAKDIYLGLNALTPSPTLYNIATNAETAHQASVEAIIEKYDLNILNLDDYSGGYSADALSNYSPGQYSLQEITTLYDTLYSLGSQSLQSALEVGCMVEVTDINDLDRDILAAEGAPDLVLVFENLRSGSYSHYWSFNTALQSMGVTEGCCVLGADFCKTNEEYPQVTHGSQSSAQGNGNAQQGGRH
jgi:hypothetical protein